MIAQAIVYQNNQLYRIAFHSCKCMILDPVYYDHLCCVLFFQTLKFHKIPEDSADDDDFGAALIAMTRTFILATLRYSPPSVLGL